MWPILPALVHIDGARRRHAIRLPALLAHAPVAACVRRLHTGAMPAQIASAAGQTVDGATRAVRALPAGGAFALIRADGVHARRPVLAAEIGAREGGTLVAIRRTRGALVVRRARAAERAQLVVAGATVRAGRAGAVVALEGVDARREAAIELVEAPAQ